MTVAEVEAWIEKIFSDVEGPTLRAADRKEPVALAAFMHEIERLSGRRNVTIVDSAKGKGEVGRLAAVRLSRPRAVLIERDAQPIPDGYVAAIRFGMANRCTSIAADVREGS